MKKVAIALWGCLMSVIATSLSFADEIANLSTGTATYTYIADNIYGNPGLNGTAASVVTPANADWYGGWIPNSADSSWVAVDPNNQQGNSGIYLTQFSLVGFDLSTVDLKGSWTTDDQGVIDLNGHVIQTLGNGNWGSLLPFDVLGSSGWFNQGTNTLLVDNGAVTDNFLEGVNVAANVTGSPSSVPEPSSLALLGLGGIGLAIGAYRRRRAAVV